MTDSSNAKRALQRLARGTDADWRHCIDLASDAVENISVGAQFLDANGRQRLECAVERAAEAGDEQRLDEGRRALTAFENYQRSAASDHFHRGHDTDLRGPAICPNNE
ncbi:hypothetical protein VB779_11270 [Haloarculaceae archaeon H-GB11]|nr:hypothetical protein [Haloarculaceae archaeon H-GB11]